MRRTLINTVCLPEPRVPMHDDAEGDVLGAKVQHLRMFPCFDDEAQTLPPVKQRRKMFVAGVADRGCTRSFNGPVSPSGPGRGHCVCSCYTLIRSFGWQVTVACLAASASAFVPCAVPAHTRIGLELSLRTSRGGASAVSMVMNTAESDSRR